MKNKHPKRKLAVKMMSKAEKKGKISPYSSKAWLTRSEGRRIKLIKKSNVNQKNNQENS